jgi:hypothetical protein
MTLAPSVPRPPRQTHPYHQSLWGALIRFCLQISAGGPEARDFAARLPRCWETLPSIPYIWGDSEVIDDRGRSALVGALTRFCFGRARSDP